MSKPPRRLRARGWVIGVNVRAVLWGLGLAFLLTGTVLWRDRHDRRRRGIGIDGRVVRGEWKEQGGVKHHSGRDSAGMAKTPGV